MFGAITLSDIWISHTAERAGADYGKRANGEILAFAMIETAEGMSELDAIAATPGLDGIYVGPADLSLSLTAGRLQAGFDREEPEMIQALKSIVAACKKHFIASALHCGTTEYAKKAIEWGFNMVTVSSDARLISNAVSSSVAEFRSAYGPSSLKVHCSTY